MFFTYERFTVEILLRRAYGAIVTPLSTDVQSPRRSKDLLRLWLRMLATTGRVEHEVTRRLRDRFDVTLSTFDLMAELARAPQPQTMSAISDQLMISNANVTGLVDRLSSAGLVERQPSPTDRRVWLLDLTAEGRAAFQEMATEHEGWITELFGHLTDPEIAALGELLRTTRDGLGGDRPEA